MEVSVLSSGDGQIFHRSVERWKFWKFYCLESFKTENWKMKKVLLSGDGLIFHMLRSIMIVFWNTKICLMMMSSSISWICWGEHHVTHSLTGIDNVQRKGCFFSWVASQHHLWQYNDFDIATFLTIWNCDFKFSWVDLTFNSLLDLTCQSLQSTSIR